MDKYVTFFIFLISIYLYRLFNVVVALKYYDCFFTAIFVIINLLYNLKLHIWQKIGGCIILMEHYNFIH